MKRLFLLLGVLIPTIVYSQEKTLRLDYVFYGDADHSGIALSELRSIDGWAGRRSHMSELPLTGNGQISVSDSTGMVLYSMSFSSLFQ